MLSRSLACRDLCRFVALAVAVAALSRAEFASHAQAQPPGPGGGNLTPGVLHEAPGVFAGYTLLSPLQFNRTFLMDMQGKVVHSWTAAGNPASVAYLLENGHLLRPCALPNDEQTMGGAAAGGRIQEFDWDGNIVWDFKFANEKHMQHHDITRMPNGNILMIVWDRKSKAEAVAMGRRAEGMADWLMSDSIIEIKPTGPTSGEIVWQWNLWDHLIQDYDRSKSGFGRVGDHPELVDINFGDREFQRMLDDPAEVERLRALGYLGGGGGNRGGNAPPAEGDGGGRGGRGGQGGGGGGNTDWIHTNSVAYNADLDQILLSIHNLHEIWIIDHSTTTEQAAGHTGGKSGKGGDLLYRWGNPRAYRSGTNVDQKLYAQHNAHWIEKGLPGAGHIMIYNNGQGRPDGAYSTIEEIAPPMNPDGSYQLELGLAYGPEETVWTYAAPEKTDLYSNFISGAHRLPNGNTLICAGATGTLFEVTADKELVWKFQNSTFGGGGGGGGRGGGRGGPPGGGPGGRGGPPGGPGGGPPGGPPGPPPLGQVMPPFLDGMLQLTAEQRQQVNDLQAANRQKLEALLTPEQIGRLQNPDNFDFSLIPPPGQLMSPASRERLTLSPEQATKLDELQAEITAALGKILQAGQVQQMAQLPPPGAPLGPPGGPPGDGAGRGGRGGPDGGRGGGGRGGRGGGGGGGGPRGTSLFRAYRIAPDYPGLAGKELTPGPTLEELSQQLAAAGRGGRRGGGPENPPPAP